MKIEINLTEQQLEKLKKIAQLKNLDLDEYIKNVIRENVQIEK